MGFNLGDFFNNIGTAAGHALGVLPKDKHITGVDWHGIDNFTSSIGHALSSVPVVGGLLKGVADIATTPFSFAEDILKGERIDHVLVDQFNRQVGAIKGVAPFAQAVVSFVPGVGTAVSAAIGAGLALANGRPIDEAIASAVSGAIPGGPLAGAAYKIGEEAMTGRLSAGDAGAAALDALSAATGMPVPPAAERAITGGLTALQAAANGKRPDAAVMQAAIGVLTGPAQSAAADAFKKGDLKTVADKLVDSGESLMRLQDSAKKQFHGALQTGVAMQHAINLQSLTRKGITDGTLSRLAGIGRRHAAHDPPAAIVRRALHTGQDGFDTGLGMMAHAVTPYQAHAVRSKLGHADAHGFDMAAAYYTGRTLQHRSARPLPPYVVAGHALVHGMRASGDAAHRESIARTAGHDPDLQRGAHAAASAASHLARRGNREGFFAFVWHAFKKLLGIEKEVKTAIMKAGDEAAGDVPAHERDTARTT
jgi:hypothetical protein